MEICTIGGYEEVGKNMTAVRIGDDVIIFDAGIYLPPLIDLQEQESFVKYNEHMLRKIKAIPNDLVLDELGWTDKVRAIVIGHAHLDHVGGLPYLASRYPKAEIIATHFTMEVLNSILEDDKLVLHNKRTIIKSNSRLKELGRKKQIKCLVVDSLYADTERRTASERIARDLLEDALSVIRDRNSALFITTFSSHIARLKSIVEFGKKTGRQIVFMGRSLMKYVNAAKNVRECSFYHQIRIMKYRKQINSFLKKVEDERGKYLVVCTGHQGEKGAILDRMLNDETPFKFRAGDNVIFSSSVIPVPQNINAREKMDKKLRAKGARIQTDIHVSGHGGREDLRDLVNMLEPGHIIPAHGSMEQEIPMVELAKEMGYKFQENVHLSSNGKVVKI